jgi:hypothetical protein
MRETRTGRHRRQPTRGFLDVVGAAGTAVSLAALLVLAGAAGALTDGVSADAVPTVTVTFDGG